VQARIQTHLNIKRAQRPPALAERVLTAASAGLDELADHDLGGTATDFPTVRERMVIGDYEIVEELGRGGMGIVYKARHLRMDRLVALKLIDRRHLSDPEAVSRFYLEVQAAAKLHHPNVVIAYDAGQVGRMHFFAMELVDGTDLGRLVTETGALPVLQACDFIRQAALGLQHAHERGMVHRDIKPTNLLVTWVPRVCEHAYVGPNRPSRSDKEPVVKVLDLGLALLHQPPGRSSPSDELTREGRVVGSVDYMAPEQWLHAHKVDIRADLYSLGCTFYFLLTGSVPFPGEEAMEKMLKHHLDQPRPIPELRPEVPAKVVNVVNRLIAKRPEERYQTPGDLAELLKWICQTNFNG
jgi:serine/threonine-protein kinase